MLTQCKCIAGRTGLASTRVARQHRRTGSRCGEQKNNSCLLGFWREFWWFQSTGEHTKRRWKITMKFLVNQRTSYEPCSIAMLVYQRVCSIKIPLTISTTKRVNTCLIPSPVSWRIQAKKWTRAPVFVVKGRALYLVAAFHLALKNRKCIW